MSEIKSARSTGGKGWLAWCEPAGQFDRDPYHGLIPRVIFARGETEQAARDMVWGQAYA